MCEINGYLFDYRGEPIHHLLKEETTWTYLTR
jgi:hypothetical protein